MEWNYRAAEKIPCAPCFGGNHAACWIKRVGPECCCGGGSRVVS